MSNECRYHAVGDSVYFQGILRVRCSNGKTAICCEEHNENSEMAQSIAKHLNFELETMEGFEPKKGVK